MNLIKIEWSQIKTHVIRERMIEDEYDPDLAVIEALKGRGEPAN